MLLIGSFSPTKVLLSHSLTSSTPIPSLDHNNFFQINEPNFRELIRKFFASFEFDASPCRYETLYTGVTFRLGGVEREMSLLEFGWRVGLYSEGESRDIETLSDDEEGDGEGGNEGVRGSADIYRNMSQGDWQVRQARWMDQQDERWGRIDAWMGQ
ncbi:hypothetical protein Tco_0237808 [Tanacetum coccineum]